MKWQSGKNITIHRDMEYKCVKNDEKPILLAEGTMNGYKFKIINLWSHPCCYIGIPKDSKLNIIDYDDIPIDVHGGLTYKGHEPLNPKSKLSWIGWDYAHLGDYFPPYEYSSADYIAMQSKNKKWTLDELFDDVGSAAYQLKQFEMAKIKKARIKKPKRKLQRQAMSISATQLRTLADELENEAMGVDRKLHTKTSKKVVAERTFIVPIINKTGWSDDWKFEKAKSKTKKPRKQNV